MIQSCQYFTLSLAATCQFLITESVLNIFNYLIVCKSKRETGAKIYQDHQFQSKPVMASVIPLGRRACVPRAASEFCSVNTSSASTGANRTFPWKLHGTSAFTWQHSIPGLEHSQSFHVQLLYSLTAVVARSIWNLFLKLCVCVPIVCVYLCMYAFCECLSIHMYMCNSGQWLIVDVLFTFYFVVLRQDFSLNLELTNSAKLMKSIK